MPQDITPLPLSVQELSIEVVELRSIHAVRTMQTAPLQYSPRLAFLAHVHSKRRLSDLLKGLTIT